MRSGLPLPNKLGTTSTVLRILALTPRPECGIDCLIHAIFVRSDPADYSQGGMLGLLYRTNPSTLENYLKVDEFVPPNQHVTSRIVGYLMSRIVYEKIITLNLSGNEVYYTDSLMLSVKNIVCSKLHCQKGINPILCSYATNRVPVPHTPPHRAATPLYNPFRSHKERT